MTVAAVPARAAAPAMLPVLRAANASVYLDPDDRKYGTLLVGGQGSGKTSAMLRMYLNDIRDPNAAVIVIDPKSELTRLALKLTPPDCAKRVWYLNLGRPAFGMTPLKVHGDNPLPIEASAIADNVVASLLDINEGQIFQSSRRYLYHAVIGALALAHHKGYAPKFEDVYSLLMPKRADFREAAATACARAAADLDQTADFFLRELKEDLELNSSGVAQRLDAPRNKVAGLVGVPPLRRFFNHTTDMPLRRIVQSRDILLVDANMAAVGTDNSRACMHFVLRMLHTQLQRQVQLPEAERPRVALHVDEAHYIASTENVVDQIATHRAAGLDVTFGLQYLAQLGSGSEKHEEKIRSGVVNLLQSRFLFRLGDPRDAEEATRIAMAVYQSMIHSDPDSRAQMRVTPEVVLNLPRFHCLASWIANGTRAQSFFGQTYAMPHTAPDTWADWHLARQEQRVAPYPEVLPRTLQRTITLNDEENIELPADDVREVVETQVRARQTKRSSNGAPSTRDAVAASRRDVVTATADPVQAASASVNEAAAERQVAVEADVGYPAIDTVDDRPLPDTYKAAELPPLEDSPVRRLVGRPPRGRIRYETSETGELPESLRDLAFIDRVNEVREAMAINPAPKSLPRLYDQDLAIIKLLDRNGLTLPALIGRATMPGRSDSQVSRQLKKLWDNGLVGRHKVGIRQREEYRGALPWIYELTPHGFQTGQQRGVISQKREYRRQEVSSATRVPHDHHALAWMIELDRIVGRLATDNWRTPRYATGRFPVPQVGAGHRRRQVSLGDLVVPEGQALFDLDPLHFTEIKPDVAAELFVPGAGKLRFDLFVEFQHNGDISSLDVKFKRYDQFLTGWCCTHRRFQQLATRPVVVVVAADERELLAIAKNADQAMRAAVGLHGTPEHDWYYAGRDHTFFALEKDAHLGSLQALALPAHPPKLRARLGAEGLELTRVELIPASVAAAAREAR